MRGTMIFAGIVAAVLPLSGCLTVRINTHEEGVCVASQGCCTGFINKTMEVDGQVRKYVVYVPADYDPSKQWPLIMFLHGMGERGDDGLKQSEVGIGHAIRLDANMYPGIVVMPQCPVTKQWAGAGDHIDAALAKSLKEYSIDPKRVYLTGLSMGGFGSWIYGAQHTDTYAAIMPICGGGNAEDAQKLAAVPIWAFHGGVDSVVNPQKSRDMVAAVKAAGGNVQYTEYPDVNHNSWDKTYTDSKVAEWLMSQKKN